MGDSYGNGKEVTPSLQNQQIVGKRTDSNGSITSLKLADGTEVDHDTAISMASGGQLDGVIVQQGNQGQPVLRSKPDGSKENNLSELPEY